MSENSEYEYHQLADQFIQLANKMKDSGHSIELVNAALMTASGVYTTFVSTGGNNQSLTESGINKIVDVYKKSLENVQKIKQAQSDLSV